MVDEQDVYLDSVALNLHSFYSGLERLFEIARHIDCSVPEGETWHRDLLDQMACEVADIRPAISDHQQSWGYEDGPWKGPGPPLLVAADFLIFFLISVLLDLLVLMTT